MSVDPPSEVAHVLGPYRLTLATGFGPRITSVTFEGGGDMFARLPDSAVIAGPKGDYHLRGGHRLWAAPEVPDVTYAPDDHQCQAVLGPDRFTVSAPPDAAGFAKQITVSLDGGELVVDHRLTNAAARPQTAAAWAVTQVALGGTALVALVGAEGEGLQADRSLVLWPYTRLDDSRIRWSDGAVAISAIAGARLKLGSAPGGAQGYLHDGFLFLKVADRDARPRPDRGAASQVFVDDQFCELETVGALATLEPGESTHHRETWTLAPCADLGTALGQLAP